MHSSFSTIAERERGLVTLLFCLICVLMVLHNGAMGFGCDIPETFPVYTHLWLFKRYDMQFSTSMLVSNERKPVFKS